MRIGRRRREQGDNGGKNEKRESENVEIMEVKMRKGKVRMWR